MKRNKKINYYIANNIRFLAKTVEQHKKLEIDEEKKLTEKKICDKYGITLLTYNRIIKGKIYAKPPKIIRNRQEYLETINNQEFQFICNNIQILTQKRVWRMKKAERVQYRNSLIEIHQEYREKFKKSISELIRNVKVIHNLFYKSTNIVV